MTTQQHQHRHRDDEPPSASPRDEARPPVEPSEPATHRDLRALQELSTLLRQKWAPGILLVLADTGAHSYTTLLRQVNELPVDGHLTPKTALATTRTLEERGLITISRDHDGDRFSTRTAYALTQHGHQLVAELRANLAFMHPEDRLPRQRRPMPRPRPPT